MFDSHPNTNFFVPPIIIMAPKKPSVKMKAATKAKSSKANVNTPSRVKKPTRKKPEAARRATSKLSPDVIHLQQYLRGLLKLTNGTKLDM